MDTVLEQPWTTERFLAWDGQREGKHEFDGRRVLAMTGGSLAHQRIVMNLCFALMGLLGERPFTVTQEMRCASARGFVTRMCWFAPDRWIRPRAP